MSEKLSPISVIRGSLIFPGYAAIQSGEVLSMRRILPWWDYRQQKTQAIKL